MVSIVGKIPVSLPIFLTREGRWFVASCPVLDIATQGKTEKEVKENMEDLINEYFNDPDTVKPPLQSLMSFSLTNIPIKISEGVLNNKTKAASSE
jgi:predicted RNase H-like HicB family nuclease